MRQGLVVDDVDGPLGGHHLLHGVNVNEAASIALTVVQVDQDTCHLNNASLMCQEDITGELEDEGRRWLELSKHYE